VDGYQTQPSTRITQPRAVPEHAEFWLQALVVSKGVADRFNDSVFVKHALSVKKLQYIARMPHLDVRRSQLKAAAIVNRDMAPLRLRDSVASMLRVLESDRGWDVWPVLDSTPPVPNHL
jgi:hypothetical protein